MTLLAWCVAWILDVVIGDPPHWPHPVRIGTVKMHKRQIAADIPYAFIAFRHQTKTIRAAAIFPAVRRLLIAFVAISDVQT